MVFERQDERAGVIAFGTLAQGGQVDAVGPVTARVDEALFSLVRDEELVAADIGLDGDERLSDGLVGKAPGQHAEIVVRRVLFRLRRRTARNDDEEQQQEMSCPEYHGTPIPGDS